MKTDIPQFTSEHINRAISRSVGVFDTHQATLDSISQDIKNIECYLISKNLAVPFTCKVSSNSPLLNRDSYYSMAWNKSESGKMRLLVREQSFVDGVGIVDTLPWRPLIEAPIKVRMAVSELLPQFIDNYAEFLKVKGHPQVSKAADDIFSLPDFN